jgi:hypothetical protein
MEILQGNELEVISPEQQSVDAAVAEAEKRIEFLNKVMAVALKRTYEQDWVDFQGKPYLVSSGAERLRPLFGIKFTDLKWERMNGTDEKGSYYVYIVTGNAHFRGDVIPVIGTCSSRDQFFAVRYDENNEKYYLPSSEVDPTNILKAAYSNMITNGVVRILGLRNLTWEQLKEQGLDPEKAAKVKFTSKRQAGKKFEELSNKLNEICGGSEELKNQILKQVTSYKAYKAKNGKEIPAFDGYNSLEELKQKAKHPEQASAIALNELNKLIKSGQIDLIVKGRFKDVSKEAKQEAKEETKEEVKTDGGQSSLFEQQ